MSPVQPDPGPAGVAGGSGPDVSRDGYRIELATLRDQATLVVRGTVGEPEIGAFLAGAFGRVPVVAQGNGITLSGPPFAKILPQADGSLHIEAGYPVSGMPLGQGVVMGSHLPGGPALRTTHRGDYAQARHAHEALHAFAACHDMRPAGDSWEVYVDEPDVAQPRTVVVLPIRPADG